MEVSITKQAARKFLLQKQHLFHPQSLTGKKGIETVFNSLRLIQYDSLNPCGRNVDLVLQARVRNIHPNNYYTWLYNERKGIECYDKELCIIPIEDLPLTVRMRTKIHRHVRIQAFIKKYQQELEGLLQKIEKNGSLCSADIRDTQK